MPASTPPVCSYEGSDYQKSFWDEGGRAYEDSAEAAALRRLLPVRGNLMLEVGAGAGRNTPRYGGFARVVLVDYSRTQLEQAQARLGSSRRHVYVAADVYRLPFVNGAFDAATMIRVLHHLSEPQRALKQVRDALAPQAGFILEFANKRNLKAILRFWLGRQEWSPFSLEAVEFARLNFDFHPRSVRAWCEELGFTLERVLSVSHFRSGLLKKLVPVRVLTGLDAALQPTGRWWQLTPSIFYGLRGGGAQANSIDEDDDERLLFKCPECGQSPLDGAAAGLKCGQCGRLWGCRDGIYDFRAPLGAETA